MWKTMKSTSIQFHGGLTYIFYLTSVITLTLLIPLSFLLLARLSTANYFLTTTHSTIHLNNTGRWFHHLISLMFLYTSPTLLHILVAAVILSAFITTLTGHITLLPKPTTTTVTKRITLHRAWIFLCILQVFVGLGIEASLGFGSDHIQTNNYKKGMFSRVVFFIGLHETMLHWSRMVVKPVVDDTVYGHVKDENWAERALMAAACGWLWLVRLRDEVESLVAVVEGHGGGGQLQAGIGDFVGWWLYYLTVTIGVARVIKGVMWVSMIMFCRRFRDTLETALEDDEDDDDVDFDYDYNYDDVLVECRCGRHQQLATAALKVADKV